MSKKLKVGCVVPYFSPLSETFVYNYAKDTDYYDVYVFALERQNEELFPHPRVSIVGTFDKMGEAIAKVQPDILHAHFGPAGLWLLPTVIELQIPLIVMFLGYDASRLLRDPAMVTKYQVLFKYATKIVAVSQTLRDNLVQAGCPEEKVSVFRLSLDTDCFNYTPIKEEQQVRFLTCSRHVEKKGLTYVIKAFAQLVAELGNRVALRIIGGGPLSEALKEQAAPLIESGHIEFIGPQPSSVVLKEMKKCHIFIQASVTAANGDLEGTPTVIAEALAIGRPVLGTYHSGIPEMIQHEQTGLLSPEKDVNELAKNMKRLALDSSLREKMGAEGRKFVAEEFSAAKLRDKLALLYQKEIAEFAPVKAEARPQVSGKTILIFRVVPMCNMYYHLNHLKQVYPESRIIVFSPRNTAESCAAMPLADEVVVNDQPRFSVNDCDQSVLRKLRDQKVELAVIPFAGGLGNADNLVELSWALNCQEVRLIDDNFHCRMLPKL